MSISEVCLTGHLERSYRCGLVKDGKDLDINTHNIFLFLMSLLSTITP